MVKIDLLFFESMLVRKCTPGIFLSVFREIRFDISCELFAWQTIHMKCQSLFSQKQIKKKQKRILSVTILYGTLRVKTNSN